MKTLALLLAFIPAIAMAEDVYQAEMRAIAFVESTNGQNMEHKVIGKGMNKGTRAGGRFGLMPITAKDLISKSAYLRNKYAYVLNCSNDQVTMLLTEDARMDKEIAFYFWKQLRKKYGPRRSAYAWLNGPARAAQATSEKVLNSEYVQKFHDYMLENFTRYEYAKNP